jgi:acetyl esterase/lipase
VLPQPKQTFHPEIISYKKINSGGELKLHVFRPDAAKFHGPRPAIVFFFGGGWTNGTPLQFHRECAWLASRGMVAISADYRIASVNKSTPMESLEDAKSAIRWVRQHAAELNVDPRRIAASGCSAGGHLAAAAALTQGFENANENLKISSRPDALVLNYPVIDNGPTGYGYERVKTQYAAFSPMHAMSKCGKVPPTAFFLGTQDKLIPVATAEAFKQKMEAAGGRCDLYLYEGRPHPIFEYRKGESPLSRDVLKKTDDFLVSIKYLDAQNR